MEYIRHQNLSAKQIERIERELDQDEQIVLIAPFHLSLLSPACLGLLCFSIVWLSLFLTIFAYNSQNITTQAKGSGFFVLCAFVLFGFALFAAPFAISKKAANTMIGFTDKRLIVASRKKSYSVPLKQLHRISYVEHANKHGRITLASPFFLNSFPADFTKGNVILKSLPHVKAIEKILRSCCLQRVDGSNPVNPVAWSAESLDRNTKMMIESRLEEGESLIWAGKPVPSISWFPAIGMTLISALPAGMLYAVYPDCPPIWLLIPGTLVFAIPAFCYYRAQQPRRACRYVVTNKRAAIFHPRMFNKFEAVNFLPCNLEILDHNKRKNGTGTLVFYYNVSSSNKTQIFIAQGFLKTSDVDLAEQAINNLIAAQPHSKN